MQYPLKILLLSRFVQPLQAKLASRNYSITGMKVSCFCRNNLLSWSPISCTFIYFSPFWRLLVQIHTLFHAFQGFVFAFRPACIHAINGLWCMGVQIIWNIILIKRKKCFSIVYQKLLLSVTCFSTMYSCKTLDCINIRRPNWRSNITEGGTAPLILIFEDFVH